MLLSNFNLLATAPGGVARLRELILTLAVQGKLVSQDLGDEPASILLKKIRDEKDRLITEGKIRRDKPLAKITDEEKPFELPVGWEWVRLPDITYNLGQGAPTEQFTYIDVAAIDNEKAVVTDAEIVEAGDAPSRARKNVTVGTVIYSTVRPYLKNIAVVEKEYVPKAIASTAFAIMHPHSGLHSKYLLHYLRSAVFTEFVSSKAVGVAYPAINDANFFEGVIALPPFAEQSRIVNRVEELMHVCDALEAKGKLEAAQYARLVSTLLGTLTDSDTPEALAQNWQRIAAHFNLLLDRPQAVDAFEQTILQLAMRGLLVPQDPSDEPASVLLKKIRMEKDRLMAEGMIRRDKPLAAITEEEKQFEVPYGWEWGHLSNICIQVTDGTHQTPKYTISGRPFLSAKNVKPFKFMPHPHRFVSEEDFHALRKGRIPTHGDILMTRVGAMIGEAAEIDSDIEFAFYVSLALLSLPKSLVSPRFLVMWLNSPFGTAKSVEKTLGRGVSAGNLNLSFIRSFAIPLPPLREQFRIVARVEELRRLCADLRQRLSASQTTQAHLAEALVESVAG